jgi:PAS domain S-box-containing protein
VHFSKRAALASASVILSTIVALGVEPSLGDKSPFLTFTVAIIVSASYGGLWFGMASTIASFLIAHYLFVPPVHHFLPTTDHGFMLLALFVVVGLSISLLQSRLAAANARLAAANETLSRSREQIELAAESAKIGFTESLEGGKVIWTPEMERLCGLEAGSFEGTIADWLKRIHPDDRTRFDDVRRKQIEDRVPEVSYEYRIILPDGQTRWLEARRRLIMERVGVTRVVGASVDITDRYILEQELRQRSDELKRSNQELEQFAYRVAHDLQSPVRAIGTLIQLFLKRSAIGLDEESQKLLAMVVDSAERMKQLVNDTLALARATHGEISHDLVDCESVVRLAIQEVLIQNPGAMISVGALPALRADRGQLLRVFENLIGNAVKYCGERTPQVTIGAALENGEWVFSVRDNGIGINPADHDRIFQEFERLHNGSDCPGSGLGLSICRRVVERHHGRIWVESIPGEGSTFRFTLRATPLGNQAASADMSSVR